MIDLVIFNALKFYTVPVLAGSILIGYHGHKARSMVNRRKRVSSDPVQPYTFHEKGVHPDIVV